MRLRPLARLVAAVLMAAAAGLAVPAAPARAAYCSGSGVSALVDFGTLGGGAQTGCGSGTTAAQAFSSAGFTLTQDPRQPGFVCRVEGKPAEGQPCSENDAYWAFFVSDDGKGWVYASTGVYATAVDPGDSVALVWQSSTSRRTPQTPPAVSSADDEPSAKATRSSRPKPRPGSRPTRHAATTPSASATRAARTASPTTAATPAPTSGTTSPHTSPDASRQPGRQASHAARRHASATATPSATAQPSTGEAPADTAEPASADDGGGLPGWVPPALVAVLLAAAGGVALARRAR